MIQPMAGCGGSRWCWLSIQHASCLLSPEGAQPHPACCLNPIPVAKMGAAVLQAVYTGSSCIRPPGALEVEDESRGGECLVCCGSCGLVPANCRRCTWLDPGHCSGPTRSAPSLRRCPPPQYPDCSGTSASSFMAPAASTTGCPGEHRPTWTTQVQKECLIWSAQSLFWN